MPAGFATGPAGPVPFQQAQAAAGFRLSTVQVTGARRLTPAERITLSRREAGQTVTVADFDATATLMAGPVEFVGLTDTAETNLKNRCRMRSGAVYDATYPSQFIFTEVISLMCRGNSASKPPDPETRVAPRNGVVDVRFVFK